MEQSPEFDELVNTNEQADRNELTGIIDVVTDEPEISEENILQFQTKNRGHAIIIEHLLKREGEWLAPREIVVVLDQFPEFAYMSGSGKLYMIRKAIEYLNRDSTQKFGVELVEPEGKSTQKKNRLNLRGIYALKVQVLEEVDLETLMSESKAAIANQINSQRGHRTSEILDGIEKIGENIEIYEEKQALVKLKAGEFIISFRERLEFLIFQAIARNQDGITQSELFDELKKQDMKSPFSYTEVLNTARSLVKGNPDVLTLAHSNQFLTYRLRS